MKPTTVKKDQKKTIRVRRLRDIMPYEVALVPRGANGRSFLVVKADEDQQAAMTARKDGETMQISLEALSKAHSQLGEIVNVLKSGTPDITTEQALSQKIEGVLRELASVDVIKSDALAGHLHTIKELTDRLAITSRDIGTIDPLDQLQIAVAKALDVIGAQAATVSLVTPAAPMAAAPVAVSPVVIPPVVAPVMAPVIAPVMAPVMVPTPASTAPAVTTPVTPTSTPTVDPVAELVKSITGAVKAGVAEAMAALKPATVVAPAPLPMPQTPIAVAKVDLTTTPTAPQGSQGEVVGRGKPSMDWPEDFNVRG